VNEKPLNKDRWITFLEWLAVALNLGFTYLYIQQNSWAFLLGILGPLSIAVLSWKKRLIADTALQFIYIVLCIWGALQLGADWKVSNISIFAHCIGSSLAIILALLVGWVLKKRTLAALPYWDSLITTFSIWATILMMMGIQENWLYFIFIDLFCIFLFLYRGLPVISFLYFVYFLMALEGYFQWGWITK
jgi:nicotinamide mononucleotide transporter